MSAENEVLERLLNTVTDGIKGLIERINALERRIEQIEDFINPIPGFTEPAATSKGGQPE